MPIFENYERRIDGINEVLNKYKLESLEVCRQICQQKGFDPYIIVMHPGHIF